jgi:hypothetical protein
MAITIENNSTKVSEETVKELEKRLNEVKANEVLKEVKLRAGETDVKQLSDAEFKQAMYRFMNDTLNAYNLMINTMLDINLIMLESLSHNKKEKIVKLLDGIKKQEAKTNGKEVEKETSQENNQEVKIGLTD